MTEKQIKIIAKYTGVKELESVGEKSNYYIFTPIESNDDIKEIKIRHDNQAIADLVLKLQDKYELNWNEGKSPKRIFGKDDVIVLVKKEEDNDNNDKKAKDCPTCLEKINYALAKCQDWETKRKKQLEDLKKEGCFHEKSSLPVQLNPTASANEVTEHKNKCPKCQKEYVARKANGWGDEKTFSHNCSKNNQDDEENDDDSNNNKIAEKSTVRKYCKDNDIQKLEYDEETGKLIITYKNKNKPKSELDNLNEELQAIKNYLEKEGQKDNKNKRKFLTESDW